MHGGAGTFSALSPRDFARMTFFFAFLAAAPPPLPTATVWRRPTTRRMPRSKTPTSATPNAAPAQIMVWAPTSLNGPPREVPVSSPPLADKSASTRVASSAPSLSSAPSAPAPRALLVFAG